MAPQNTIRADELLLARGLAGDAHEATALILADRVRTGADDSIVVDKPGMRLAPDASLSVKASARFVSRGGEKLEGALEAFGIEVAGLRCIDLGASTGGFTDCLLQRGASSVVAVDVGYGQLAHKLATDPRVTIHDRTNIRTADPAELGAPFDLVVADLSFIGLAQVADAVARLVDDSGRCVLLLKPQFEADRTHVDEGGIIRDRSVYAHVITETVGALAESDLITDGITLSPLRGAQGNTEFFLSCSRSAHPLADLSGHIVHLLATLRPHG